MRVLMMRGWEALPYGATFTTLAERGVGGTELQLLHHARALREMGHDVTVIGVSATPISDEGVAFVATKGKQHVLKLLRSEYFDTDVVFANVVRDMPDLRSSLPSSTLVQVCQNGPHFSTDNATDLYAFVGHGQFAYYSTVARRLRRKFVLLPSVPPWESIYAALRPQTQRHQVIWIGSVHKQGFRRWAKAMSQVMAKDQSLSWVICAPSYDILPSGHLPAAISDLPLPRSRVQLKNLPPMELAQEIGRSKIAIASLGGEDGPVSYLDAHAAGVPLLCGDDIYGKFYNPDGTGLRCTTASECRDSMEFLLQNQSVRQEMGSCGREWIEQNLTERHQRAHLRQILSYTKMTRSCRIPRKATIQSDRKFSFRYWLERLEIKITIRSHSKNSESAS